MELRLLGPPGTGKTTRLAKRIKKARDTFGDNILICSFTRAAAHEIASRDIGVNTQNVGTLHAICFRALGNPTIAEAKTKEWNEYSPHLKLMTSATADTAVDDPIGAIANDGDSPDALFADYQRRRALMQDREKWPDNVRGFGARWERWKEETGYLDFTDLIDVALATVDSAPGAPRVAFVDEAQDFTPLQVALLRKWGATMDHMLASGDDDQVLYQFAGAHGTMLLDPELPSKQIEILSQSWRVPRKIHAVAEKWIKRASRRNEKPYAPRDDDGEIVETTATMNNPQRLIDEINDAEKADETIMLLASCSFHLKSIISMMRDEGIPFHNPFRVTRGDWNPLAKRKGVSKMDSIWSLLKPMTDFPPTWSDWQIEWFARDLRADLFVRGGKTKIRKCVEEAKRFTIDEVFNADSADFLMSFVNGNKTEAQAVAWFRDGLLASAADKYSFVLNVVNKRGINDASRKEPKVIVGTIHSVKGGEADRVVLFPDLSLAGYREWLNPTGRDAVLRQYYVGMTRARRRLIVAAPSSRTNVGKLF